MLTREPQHMHSYYRRDNKNTPHGRCGHSCRLLSFSRIAPVEEVKRIEYLAIYCCYQGGAFFNRGCSVRYPRQNVLVRRRLRSQRRLLVISLLVYSDTLVALIMWQVASMVQGALGRGQLSGIAAARMEPCPYGAWLVRRRFLSLYRVLIGSMILLLRERV
jgi:hypothetical protein